jgi:tRNA threonylcarbamoyl adenosine modification protein (Sua5/YciO/YrdC/YwlC family)
MSGGDSSAAFEACIASGGVALFPSDTVYGLACDPNSAEAVRRLYELKGREPAKASAVLFFDLDAAFAAVPEMGDRLREALGRLMPGAVTALIPNPARRFPLACGNDPETLGFRVISVPSLSQVRVPVLQSSANLAGRPDARELADVPAEIVEGADLVLDGGTLPGVASTVVDLRRYDHGFGEPWSVVREGAVSFDQLSTKLDGQFHFNPEIYAEVIRREIPLYDLLQDELARCCGTGARRILELGTGTGETARRLLDLHPGASLVGIDESAGMLEVARKALAGRDVTLIVARLQDPLPPGRFDLVASALTVHHLSGLEKAHLFERVRAALAPGGRFVLADVVVPRDPVDAAVALSTGYDKPSSVAEQLEWLSQAGFRASVTWQSGDLAVLVADAA